jgi:hypothetical protein
MIQLLAWAWMSSSVQSLVYFADKERRLVVNLDPILGFKPYISPIGLYKAKNCFVVWDSNEQGNEQPH